MSRVSALTIDEWLVRGNIQMQLAQRLKDITFKLRKREKKHFLKVQELGDEPGFKTQRDKDSFINDDGTTQCDMI